MTALLRMKSDAGVNRSIGSLRYMMKMIGLLIRAANLLIDQLLIQRESWETVS